jgi:purine nucleosidase
VTESRTPILLDVDTGLDDALALGLAVYWPVADIVSVSTLAGNITAQNTTANTLAVLDWVGANEVPVFRGASRPLVKEHVHAAHVHGDTGLGAADLPRSQRREELEKGPASIVRAARERPGELTLVCTGPLTNLAIALNVEPAITEWLRNVVIMGGAYDVPGNITQFAEFNFYADPEAAQQVLEGGFPDLTLVGLDVSHQTELPKAAWEAAGRLTSPPARLLTEVCKQALTEFGRDGVYLHDPLALGIALDPTLAGYDERTVKVVLDGEERGRTISSPGGSHKVASSVDAHRFLARMAEAYGIPVEAMLQPSNRLL